MEGIRVREREGRGGDLSKAQHDKGGRFEGEMREYWG